MQGGATHSWLTSAVDGTDFGPVNPIQLKPLKYEDQEDEGAMGAKGAIMAIMEDFCVYIHIKLN